MEGNKMKNIMSRAWKIYKESGCSTRYEFSLCLKISWAEHKEAQKLEKYQGVINVRCGKFDFTINVDTCSVYGQTYYHKEQIKEFGLKWNPDTKSWGGTKKQVQAVAENFRLYVKSQPSKKIDNTKPCPRCGTYCYGDCAA